MKAALSLFLTLFHKKQVALYEEFLENSSYLEEEFPEPELFIEDPPARMIELCLEAGLYDTDGHRLQLSRKNVITELFLCHHHSSALNLEMGIKENNFRALDSCLISSRHLKMNETVYPCQNLGPRWHELLHLGTHLEESDAVAFLSKTASDFPQLYIRREGYRNQQGSPLTAEPGLVFEGFDSKGRLRIRQVYCLHPFPPGFLDKYKIRKRISFTHQKRLTVSEITFSESVWEQSNTILERVADACGQKITRQKHCFRLPVISSQELLQNHIEDLSKTCHIHHTKGFLALMRGNSLANTPPSSNPAINYLDCSPLGFSRSYRHCPKILMILSDKRDRNSSDTVQASDSAAMIRRIQDYCLAEERYLNGRPDEQREKKYRKAIPADSRYKEALKSFYLCLSKNLDQKGNEKQELYRGRLLTYQRYGLAWLSALAEQHLGGCLADDMGLGKTIQIIALLRRYYPDRKQFPSLIIMPKTLLPHWEKELRRFAPELHTLRYHGPGRTLLELEGEKRADLYLSTYTTVSSDIGSLEERKFLFLILDESQMIKNIKTKRAQAVLRIKASSRFALSGTPIENNLYELFSLFRILQPPLFGGYSQFSRKYIKPIQNGRDIEKANELKQRIYPFLLRRTKEEMLEELPEKQEHKLLLDIDPLHAQLYVERQHSLLLELDKKNSNEGFFSWLVAKLKAIGDLRRMVVMPEKESSYNRIHIKRRYLIEKLPQLIEEGHKIIICSNFRAPCRTLSADLASIGISSLFLHGGSKDPEGIVETFQSDPLISVLMMTSRTGGVGLNLTAADTFFLLDPWWNRAVEQQAADRCHRIGQERPVNIYRMIARNTIEEKMLIVQNRKTDLSSRIITSDAELPKNLTKNDIDFLLS